MTDTEEPKIGVFVCHCGHNIAGTVDVKRVAETARGFPHVCFATDEMFMCSDAGQQLIRDKVKELGLNRVVVASCSPRMHEPTFRRVVEEAGLNRYLFEQANLREHVSWCHIREPELATKKAIDLVRMAVARAARLQALPIKRVSVAPKTLVLGGGIAGLIAAADIADRGFDVLLVEREDHLGGNVLKWNHMYPGDKTGAEVLADILARVKANDRIKVLLQSTVSAVDGYVGNFDVTIKNLYTGQETNHHVGVMIVTTGFQPYRPEELYGYGESPDIMTLAEFQMLPTKDDILLKRSDNKPARKIAFIGCVGSREPGVKGHEHCSRYCCSAVAKTAADVRSKADEVLVLYQDVRTYGRGHEEFYRLAREKHVIYSKFPSNEKPLVAVSKGKINIRWHDVLADESLQFQPDLLILATAMVPSEGVEDVARLFGLTRSSDGFFNPEHIKLAPLTTHTAGVMIAGAAQAAKNAAEAVIDASGAAAKAASLMARGELEIESTVAHVDPDRCSSCRTCVTACPYHAISMDTTRTPPVALVTEAKCHGCGTCAASCPSRAIVMLHSTDEQIMSMIEAFLCPTISPSGGVSI